MRRVCRTWRIWISTVPVNIIWPVRKAQAEVPISKPALSTCISVFGGLTGLSLGNYALSPSDIEKLGELLGPRLKHLQFHCDLFNYKTPKEDRMGAFTALESLSISPSDLVATLFKSFLSRAKHATKYHNVTFGVFSFLHTLEIIGEELSGPIFDIGPLTRFPALTSIKSEWLGKVTHPGVFTQLRQLSLRSGGSDLTHTIQAPNLRELTLCHLDRCPHITNDVFNVTALTLLGGDINFTFVARFPSLRYLDISQPQNPEQFNLKVLPELSELSTLRAIDSPFEWFILKVRRLVTVCKAYCRISKLASGRAFVFDYVVFFLLFLEFTLPQIECYPCLRKVIASKHQFTTHIRQRLQALRIEASEYQLP